MIHRLKSWPENFRSVVQGLKKAEIRMNNRKFKVGDLLVLREWDPFTKHYTGRKTNRWISWMDKAGTPGFVVLSIGRVASGIRI